MKTVLCFVIVFFSLIPSNVFAIKATTTEDGIACLSKESLQEMQQFVISKDRESFDAYIQNRKCIVMKSGMDVTVIDMPGMFGGVTSFIYKGIKFWTTRNGVKNYRE